MKYQTLFNLSNNVLKRKTECLLSLVFRDFELVGMWFENETTYIESYYNASTHVRTHLIHELSERDYFNYCDVINVYEDRDFDKIKSQEEFDKRAKKGGDK